ncbi:MAG: cyclic pyranopterin monophosphate synthase MoaC [Alphaproteobacteria bacterium]
MSEFSHLDEKDRPKMVDVGSKSPQKRRAVAKGQIKLNSATILKIKQNEIRKGNVLNIAEIAAIQGAKQTSNLIPLCHPLALTHIGAEAKIVDETTIEVEASASCIGLTGVEMEALTAVSVGLLTIYDMCKAIDKEMVLGNIRLLEKTKENI